MNRLKELNASIDNDPKIIATLPIADVDMLLDDMGVDLTPFIEKELNFINGIKAKWQQQEDDNATNLFNGVTDKATDLLNQFSQLIITLKTPLLEAVGGAAGAGAGGKETEKSVLSLPMEENESLSNETEDSSLMVSQGDEGWMLSFRTMQPELAGKSVLLVITDSMGKVVTTETKQLEEDDEVWEFEYAFPEDINLGQSLLIDIRAT